MNESPYMISGRSRRELKKKSSELKSLIKNFWRCVQLDIDMGGVDDKKWSNKQYERFVKRKRRIDFFLSIEKCELI